MYLNEIKFAGAMPDSNGKFKEVAGARRDAATAKFAGNSAREQAMLQAAGDPNNIWILHSSPSKIDPWMISKVVKQTDTHVFIQEFRNRDGDYTKMDKPFKLRNELFLKRYMQAGKLSKLKSIEE